MFGPAALVLMFDPPPFDFPISVLVSVFFPPLFGAFGGEVTPVPVTPVVNVPLREQASSSDAERGAESQKNGLVTMTSGKWGHG